MASGAISTALLRMQRAVFVKAMPLRQHGATALQCTAPSPARSSAACPC